MIKEIEKHLADLEKIKLKNLDDVESFRIKYISKKGILPYMFSQLKNVPNKDKREVGLQPKVMLLRMRAGIQVRLHRRVGAKATRPTVTKVSGTNPDRAGEV